MYRIARHACHVTVLLALSACGGAETGFKLPDTSALAVTVNVEKASPQPGQAQNLDNIPLTWTVVAGAASYTVHRCEVPAGVTATAAMIAAAPVEGCSTPVAVTTTPSHIDVPPLKAPKAYVYHVRACSDKEAKLCGPVIGSVVAAQSVPAEVPQVAAAIADDARQVVAGLKTTLHAFPLGGTGSVSWVWTQEAGPKVTLENANTPDLSFTAPDVSTRALLEFVVRPTDANGPGERAKVAVVVLPAANVVVKTDDNGRQVAAGHQVSLHARGSAPGLTYAWRQLSPASPTLALTGADTANPSFTAPIRASDTLFLFEVTATDPTSGRNASARTQVQVLAGVPAAQAAVPSAVPLQLAQPLLVPSLQPMAVPRPRPTVPGQPYQVPTLVPALVPTLAPPQAPGLIPDFKGTAQALLLVAGPEAVAVGGTSLSLSMTATGGSSPYQWNWTQTSGPAATLTNAGGPVLTLQVPTVTVPQALTFQARLTDASGAERTALAVVRAVPEPQAATGPTPKPAVVLAPQ